MNRLPAAPLNFPTSRIKILENEKFITTEEAATYLSLSKEALRMRIYRKQIPAYRFGRHWRFKKSELDLILEANLHRRRAW